MAEKSVIKSIDIILVLVLFSVCDKYVSAIDYCKTHLYANSMNSTQMHFTKEAVAHEFALKGQFKSLQCCAKGYRSIEWFKNGIPYPWSSDFSSLILWPQAENQTIYTRQSAINDNGNYTCVIRNDTHKTEHRIEFTVQANLPDSPMATYKPHDQYVELQKEARLYCEAFVGSVRLAASRSTISWFQVFGDGQEQKVDAEQEIITREDDQIVGALLRIPKVDKHHYGRYMCRIEIGNAAHRLEMSAWLFGTPVHVQQDSLMPALTLALSAVILVILLMFIIKFISSLSIGIRNGIRPEPTLWSEIVQLIIVNERLNDSHVMI